jgi:hypothetical protein
MVAANPPKMRYIVEVGSKEIMEINPKMIITGTTIAKIL